MNSQKLLIVINNSIRKHVFLYSLLLMSLLGYSQTENEGINSGTAGTDNSFFGAYSGQNSTGNENVFIGHSSGKNNTSNGGVFIGKDTGVANTGGENTFVGVYSGISNTSGSRNVFLGARSGINNTTGKYNTFIGFGSNHYNTAGNFNTSLGYASSYNSTTASNNVSIGVQANYLITTGNKNTSLGTFSGNKNVTGSNNTYLGYKAGFNTLGSGNIFIGYESGLDETGSDKLYIENSNIDTPLIYGDFATDIVNINGKLGIDSVDPEQKLEVNGNLLVNSFAIGSQEKGIFFRKGFSTSNKYGLSILSYDHTSNSSTPDGLSINAYDGVSFSTGSNSRNERMRINKDGNVGIGTANPLGDLHIGDNTNAGVTVSNRLNSVEPMIPAQIAWGESSIGIAGDLIIAPRTNISSDIRFYTNNGTDIDERVKIKSNGNVGIGTASPDAKLDVRGALSVGEESVERRFKIWAGGTGSENHMRIGTDYGHYGDAVVELYQNNPVSAAANPGKLIVNGSLGIGTASPDEKLTVKGKIHAQEVRVDLEAPIAPDYVFEKYFTGISKLNPDYKMPTLKEVELYTKANNHLPEIPSAQEMQANGIELKVMNLKLLQKIEELTLYTIEQQKEIDSQNEELKSQKNKNKALENRLDKIEALLNTTKD